MSRAAIYEAIVTATGLPRNNVLANYSGDGRPSDLDEDFPEFVVIRWREQGQLTPAIYRAPRLLEVWAHYPEERSTDFDLVDDILTSIENALLPMEHVTGTDGVTVTCVTPEGRSEDTRDPAFETICRYSNFRVLAR